MTAERTLPDFDDPPVVETVLGIEFQPLRGWGVPHFGLYWSQIQSDYPHFQVQPAVGTAPFVPVGLGAAPPGSSLILVPKARCWFFNPSRSRLIQVQDDRFMQNWIKTGPDQPYVHYADLRPIFLQEWQRFLTFLGQYGIGQPEPTGVEVTYVNHLEQGKGWQGFADLPSVFAPWRGTSGAGFLGPPDAVALNARFPIPGGGSLAVIAEPAIRSADGKSIIQLRITASTQLGSSTTEAIAAAIDRGRSQVVNGFAEFTAPEMHKIWKRTI